MELFGKPPIHPVTFYSGKIAGYFTWAIMICGLVGIIKFPSVSNNRIISFVLLALALILILTSAACLGKSTRLGLPSGKTIFKSHGIYALSRNPMYVGFNLLTLSALIFTLNCLVVIAGIYSTVVYHFIILGEEKFLTERFGNEYLAYCRSVKRYF